jgi:hypothetical protein
VRKDDGDDILESITDVGKVRKDEVDSWLVIFRKENSTIDDKKFALMFVDSHIATNFGDATECNDAKSARCEFRWSA